MKEEQIICEYWQTVSLTWRWRLSRYNTNGSLEILDTYWMSGPDRGTFTKWGAIRKLRKAMRRHDIVGIDPRYTYPARRLMP